MQAQCKWSLHVFLAWCFISLYRSKIAENARRAHPADNFMRDACFNNQQKIEIICQVLIQIALIYFDLCLGHARTTTNKLVDSQPCWSFPSRINCLYAIFPPHFFISKSWLGLLHILLRTNEVSGWKDGLKTTPDIDGFSCLTYLRSSHNFLLKIGNPSRKNWKNDANLWLKLALKTNSHNKCFPYFFSCQENTDKYWVWEEQKPSWKHFVYWEIERACLWYIRCLFSSPWIITHVDKFNTFKQRVISPKDHLKDARNAKLLNNVVAPYK